MASLADSSAQQSDAGEFRMTRPDIAARLAEAIPEWSEVSADKVLFSPCGDTEWHEVFCATSPVGKAVVNVPSWTGAELLSKTAASRVVAASGLSPRLLAETGDGSMLVWEFLDGGTLKPEELQDEEIMADVGRIFARFHALPTSWFEDGIADRLSQEGKLPRGQSCWASCLWVLPWLQRLVPESNRRSLEMAGVDWAIIAQEIDALPTIVEDLLPNAGATRRTVLVHGDAHPGNIMWHDGKLRLIDFDMTAPGPAGSEFGFMALLLFRCGFSEDAMVPLALQRRFAAAYLSEVASGTSTPAPSELEVDEFLFDVHRWAYVGLLKMGLLCAILAEAPGPAPKRALMRERGPTLLHPALLASARRVLACSKQSAQARAELMQRGLFFCALDGFPPRAAAK